MKDRVAMKTETNLAGTVARPSFEQVELARKDKPDVRFTGRLVGEIDSRDESRDGGRKNSGRWTRLQLWELESGTWIAAAIGCSDRDGEIDLGEIERIPTHHVVEDEPVDRREPLEDAERQRRVMQFWGWTWLAKAFADALGWDVVEEIKE